MSADIGLILTGVIMAMGLVGVVIPALPGVPVMWVVAAIYALSTGFDRLTGRELGLLFIIAALSVMVDVLSGLIGGKVGGASKTSLYWGALAMIAGSFVVPVIGGIIATALTIYLVERFLHEKKSEKATKAALWSVGGATAGIVINLTLGIALLVLTMNWAR